MHQNKNYMRIKEILNKKGMTAKELAAACEMSEMGLSKILTGKSSANTSTIIRIAKELDVSCGELFDDYKEPSNELLCPHCGKPIRITLERINPV